MQLDYTTGMILMDREERIRLVKFCRYARAYLEGLDESEIEISDLTSMTPEELQREADWLDDMLDK